MKRSVQLLAVLAALIPQATPAADLDTLVLEKSSDWVLDYAEERCSLIRTFGDGSNAVRLQIDSYGNPDSLRLMVAGTALPRLSGGPDTIKVQLTPDTQPREVAVLQGTAGDVGAVSFSLRFLPGFDNRAVYRMDQDEQRAFFKQQLPQRDSFEKATNTVLLILDSGHRRIELKTGGMAAPLNALRDCVRSLQQSWGLDPVQDEALSRHVRVRDGVAQNFVRKFPSNMLRNGYNAFVPVRISVDAAGKAGECVVQLEDIADDFRRAVCQGLEQDFDPALDANGTPVPSIFRTFVIYGI